MMTEPFASAQRIGGLEALQLVEEFGAPLYVYDADGIRQHYQRLHSAFSAFPHELHYALKANNNLHILKLLRECGAGLDAVSIGEVHLGLAAGYAPQQILYTPNCVSFNEVQQAVDLGVRLNVDNLSLLEKVGAAWGNRLPVCLRINPHIYAGGHANIQTGHIDSKFGISIFQLAHVQRIVRSFNIQVNGLHMHTGSDILDADVFLQAADVLFEAAHQFPELQYLDFGSGFKVPYKPGDPQTDVEELGQKLAQRLEGFYRDYGRALSIWFEPGKFLVSSAGWFLVRANVVKQTVSNLFVGIDSGFQQLIRPMFYDAYHHLENLSNPQGTARIYTVVGYICETDTFARDRALPEVREGDVLAFHNAGAYGYSMASQYNSRPRPAEVLVDNGRALLVRRAETWTDLLANQTPL